jgi:ArsR family transcriptional regulator, arsenate/arsenite/antimonite-responsive transcriptional repressor
MKTATQDLNPLAFYKCLSEDTRLKCLLLLQLRKELCVCDLMTALQQSQPKVSRHLAELRSCGLVTDERQGKWVYYRINRALPDWALKVLRISALNSDAYLQDCLDQLDAETAALCC